MRLAKFWSDDARAGGACRRKTTETKTFAKSLVDFFMTFTTKNLTRETQRELLAN
jgi:hypothetical protein